MSRAVFVVHPFFDVAKYVVNSPLIRNPCADRVGHSPDGAGHTRIAAIPRDGIQHRLHQILTGGCAINLLLRQCNISRVVRRRRSCSGGVLPFGGSRKAVSLALVGGFRCHPQHVTTVTQRRRRTFLKRVARLQRGIMSEG
jgi:hypothetical protein